MPSPTMKVTLHEGVTDRLQDMLQEVKDHAKKIDTATDYTDLSRKLREALEHQASLLCSLISLVRTSAFDGDLEIFLDGLPLSLAYRYASDYHGGLIYHPAREGAKGNGYWRVST